MHMYSPTLNTHTHTHVYSPALNMHMLIHQLLMYTGVYSPALNIYTNIHIYSPTLNAQTHTQWAIAKSQYVQNPVH